MPDPDANPKLAAAAKNMIEQVGSRESRMLRARREGRASLWRSVGIVGLIGWSVVVPTLIGVTVGTWLDRRFPTRFSWTLTLLFAGLLLGCVMAWSRIKQEQENR